MLNLQDHPAVLCIKGHERSDSAGESSDAHVSRGVR